MTHRWWLQLALAGCALAQTGPYSIRTIAGHDAGGDHGLAVNAQVPFPSKVAVDKAGTVYVSELVGPIRRITPNGVITTIATVPTPYAVAPDNSNNLYIAQNGTCTITKLNVQSGLSTTVAGDGVCRSGPDGPASATSFFVPIAVVFDLQGNLLVADFSFRIRRIDLAKGTVTTIAGDGINGTKGEGGPATQAEIGPPLDLAVDPKGNIYIADNCVVHQIEASTGNLRTIAGTGTCGFSGDGGPPRSAQLNGTRSFALSPAGNVLYVGDLGNNRIRRINFDTNQITTVAGTGIAGIGGDGGPATSAQIGFPWGLAMDPGGNLLVSDYIGSRVRKIDTAGIITNFAGSPGDTGDGGPAAAAVFGGTGATAQDGKGALVVSDVGSRKIRKITPPGVVSTIAGTTFLAGATGDGGLAVNAGLANSGALVTDAAGNIYFTDIPNGTVRRISGTIINRIGPNTFNFIFGLAVDSTRQVLYATEFSGARVIRMDLSTGATSTFAGLGNIGAAGTAGNDGDGLATQHKLSSPNHLAVDAQGNVYVNDGGNNLIRRISPTTGLMTTFAGNGQSVSSGDGGKATSAGLAIVNGLAVDSSGNLLIAEGARIRRVDAVTGNISTIAGTGTAGFSGDGGPALSAQVSGANGLSTDAQGNIYFSDQGNRVRVLSPAIAGPRIAAAIVAANFGAGVNTASGTWMEIYGEKLAANTRQWAGTDFNGNQAPSSLDGVKVLIGGQQAFLDLISPGQINAQVPEGVGTGNVTVQVVNPSGSSDPVLVSAGARAPALLAPPSFTADGRLYAAALYTDGSFVGPAGLIVGVPFKPAKAGDHIILYGIGFGAVSPTTPAGTIATQSTTLPNVIVKFGSANATVEYAGLAGGFVGLDQINIIVPSGVSGDVQLSVSVNGIPMAQTLFLTLQ